MSSVYFVMDKSYFTMKHLMYMQHQYISQQNITPYCDWWKLQGNVQ